MLKKIILSILVFALSLGYFSNIAYAINNAIVYLTASQKEVNQGDEIEIAVNIQNSKIGACNFAVHFDDTKLEFIPENNKENINLVGNKVNFVWFDELGGKGAKEGEIAKFKFRAKENGVSTFTVSGDFYNQNAQEIETRFKEEEVQIGNSKVEELDGANLETLAIENVLLYPPFDAAQTNYKAEVSNQTENLKILAIPENEKVSVEIKDKDNLKEGNNLVTVITKAQDGVTTRTYRIKVYRRNLEEDKKYQEEQEKQNQELENAYKIEKTSATTHTQQERLNTKQYPKYKIITIWAITILVVVLIGFGIIYNIKRRKHTK